MAAVRALITINPRGVTLVPRYREALHQSPGSGNPTKSAGLPSTINGQYHYICYTHLSNTF
ncbi:MAG: hypothetical protein ACHBN1_35690 [Heteroscytonema crispum UTEX LB 1556]